jgi:hypothetical protein
LLNFSRSSLLHGADLLIGSNLDLFLVSTRMQRHVVEADDKEMEADVATAVTVRRYTCTLMLCCKLTLC